MTKIKQIRIIDFTDGEPTIGMGFNIITFEFSSSYLAEREEFLVNGGLI